MNKGKKNMSKKLITIIGLLVIGSLVFVVGCFDTSTKETKETKETVKNEESPMKKVDFKNFSFPIAIDAEDDKEKTLTLKDGKAEKTKDSMGAELGEVQYADLTGDNMEEAVINLGLTGEKDAKSNMVYVYTLENEKPKLLWNFETKAGDKVGLKEIKAADGKLLVEMFGDVKFEKGNFEVAESKEATDKTTKIELQWKEKQFEAVEGKPEVKEGEKKEDKTKEGEKKEENSKEDKTKEKTA